MNKIMSTHFFFVKVDMFLILIMNFVFKEDIEVFLHESHDKVS